MDGPHNILCHLFEYVQDEDLVLCDFSMFSPMVEGYRALLRDHVNDPRYLDLDSACLLNVYNQL
jgi:hypothetical protein